MYLAYLIGFLSNHTSEHALLQAFPYDNIIIEHNPIEPRFFRNSSRRICKVIFSDNCSRDYIRGRITEICVEVRDPRITFYQKTDMELNRFICDFNNISGFSQPAYMLDEKMLSDVYHCDDYRKVIEMLRNGLN